MAGVDRDRIQGLGAENKSDRDSAIKNYIFHLQKKHSVGLGQSGT